MSLELQILGPAFGLPSVDPECIALIALLSLPLTKDLEWKLVVAHDSSASPTGDFPLLRHNATVIAGFTAIVKYLKRLHNDVDDGLSDYQQATVAGIVAHLRLKAQPLVDAHLYADDKNYVHATRPAFSKILPFPFTWIIPPQRAERAASRASHLATPSSILPFSSEPASDTNEGPGSLQSTTSPSLLFAQGQRTRATLAQQATTIRLRQASAVDALCEPLAEQLAVGKDKRGGLWLIRGKFPTSADCLAFGYLSLLLEPNVPNAAITQLFHERWPRVALYYTTLKGVLSLEAGAYAARTVAELPLLPDASAPYQTVAHAARMQGLPWFRTPPPTLLERARGLVEMVLNAIIAPPSQRALTALLQSGSAILLGGMAAGSSIGIASIVYAAYTLSQRGKTAGGMPRVITFAAERAARSAAGRFGEAGALLGIVE